MAARLGISSVLWLLILVCAAERGYSQNCCAPAVPQQGVLGETVALAHTLDVGFHYEFLQSQGLYAGSREITDPAETRTEWKRATITISYGIQPGLSISTIIPYLWKRKSKTIMSDGSRLTNSSRGIGDMMLIFRFSILPRSFINFRELSAGLGVKIPTGSTDHRQYGYLLPEELQSGTGSWDFNASSSYYQGFEPVDFILSITYDITTEYNDYRFGNQFSYAAMANFHPLNYLDLTASLAGIIRASDTRYDEKMESTGRNQIWFSPGVGLAILPEMLRLQVHYEWPFYQHLNGIQVGSNYNLRFSLIFTIPLTDSDED